LATVNEGRRRHFLLEFLSFERRFPQKWKKKTRLLGQATRAIINHPEKNMNDIILASFILIFCHHELRHILSKSNLLRQSCRSITPQKGLFSTCQAQYKLPQRGCKQRERRKSMHFNTSFFHYEYNNLRDGSSSSSSSSSSGWFLFFVNVGHG
jgi:hypothetical protein